MLYEVDSIDFAGRRKDGGVELYMVSSGPLFDSRETERAMVDKVNNYARYVRSDDFKKTFGGVQLSDVTIILVLEEAPTEAHRRAIKSIDKHFRELGMKFDARTMQA